MLHSQELENDPTWTMLIDTCEYIVFNYYFQSKISQNKSQNVEDLHYNLPKIEPSIVSEYIAKGIESYKAC